MALGTQKLQIPFAAGLKQKYDDRARQPPGLDICRDVQFDDLGGLQTRLPFTALGSNIQGGGTISNARHIEAIGGELLLWTIDTVYTWDSIDFVWVARGSHLAVEVTEDPKFATPLDAQSVDRAQLSNRVVYTWTDGTQVWAAATDAVTGATIVPPTAQPGGLDSPRVIALGTKFLLVARITGGPPASLNWKIVAPATLAADLAAAFGGASAAAALSYDVAAIPGADAAILIISQSSGTSYLARRINNAGVATSSTKARASAGPIAVAVTPDGVSAQVVRLDASGNVVGDLLTVSSLADTAHINEAVGTGAIGTHKIAACHRSVKVGGQWLCQAFWDTQEAVVGSFQLKTNTVDDAGALGAQSTFVRDLGLASCAFDFGGRIFVWTVFAGGATSATGLQNTMFLYRDDALLCAKALPGNASGFLVDTTVGAGARLTCLPGVQLINGSTKYALGATERRRVPVLGGNSYAARAPRDLVFTLDANTARRCAQLGPTLYVASGEVLAYDGAQLAEVGWHIFPWSFLFGASAAGSLPIGQYAYKICVRWDNANGERDRSTTVLEQTQTIATSPKDVTLTTIVPIYTTHKGAAAIEVFRTQIAPAEDSPFFLDTSADPNATGTNGYLLNDTTVDLLGTYTDNATDAILGTHEASGENGAVLPNIAPPAATLIAAQGARLFLSGIAGFPNTIIYSKQREDGFVVGFNDELAIDVPITGGAITAIAFLDDTLVAFRATAMYGIPGSGFDDLGQGNNYGPARVISYDVGAVNAESVVVMTNGILFKSMKGWYMLSSQLTLSYVGTAVSDYDSETVLAATLVDNQHQVRVISSLRMLVFDYLVNEWSEWSITDGLDACMWNGTYVYLTTTGPKKQATSFASGVTYGLDVETAWIKFDDLQGFARVRELMLLGEWRSDCCVRIRVARDYQIDSNGAPLYFDDVTSPPITFPTLVGSPLQLSHGPSQQQGESYKVRITGVNASGSGAPQFDSFKLTGLALDVGVKKGLYKRLPAASKV